MAMLKADNQKFGTLFIQELLRLHYLQPDCILINTIEITQKWEANRLCLSSISSFEFPVG